MIGISPVNSWHLLFLFVPVLLWLVTRKRARGDDTTIMHNSSLAVSYWEELLFRGLIFDVVASLWNGLMHGSASFPWPALVISSLLFGLFHLRNLWWSTRRQVIASCLYTGLVFAPIMSVVRWWSGDIYLCIALHAIHNFASLTFSKHKVTNAFLASKQAAMNKFQYLFSGFWLMR